MKILLIDPKNIIKKVANWTYKDNQCFTTQLCQAMSLGPQIIVSTNGGNNDINTVQ